MKESGVGLDGTGRQIIDFDHYRGYGQWHRFCREHFSREAPIEDATTFAEEGFERIRFLGARDAARLLAHLKLREGVETHVHEIDTYIQQILVSGQDYLRFTFSRIFNDAVDRRIVGFFGSEYFVQWFSVTRTCPSNVPETSFLWHRDGGPTAHVKIMVYVNASEEHGGGTDFLGCEATERLAAVGYGFPLLEARLPDLTDLALRAGVDYPPPFAALAPGEGFLFRARDVLHRGILPTRGPRYVLSLVVLPSPETWKESLERWPLKRMQVPPHWDPKFMTAVGGLTVRYRSASAE